MTTASTRDWARRFQELADANTERSMESIANVQRLVLAVARAGLTPEALAAALPRYGQGRGAEVYERLARLVAAFVAGLQRVLVRAGDEYLSSVVPEGPLRALGPRAVSPPPPGDAGAAEWAAWYQLFAARAADQQAWLTRLYGLMLNEVAAGRLSPEAVQHAATEFARERSGELLAEIAELTSAFLREALEIADDTLDGLLAELVGDEATLGGELVVEGSGPPGSTFTRALAVDNERDEPAAVSCSAAPAAGFALAVDPPAFDLAPGASGTVTVRVTLPGAPTGGPVDAGTVVVRREGEADLVVRVEAAADG